jgi:branched-chain amino acid transport system permease protein
MSPQVVAQTLISGLLLGFVYSVIAVGITLIWGVMGFVNFAHADYMMLSMYAAFWFNNLLGIDPFLSLPVIAGLMFLAGVLTYRMVVSPVIDAPISIQLFVSFGVLLLLRGGAQFLWTADYRSITGTLVSGRLEVFGLFLGLPQLAAGAGAILLDLLLYWLVRKTELGRALRAVAEDSVSASLMGIDSGRMFALAWGLAIASAGIAGGLISTYYYIFPTVGVIFGIMGLLIVSLAGFGSIPQASVVSLVFGVGLAVAGLLFSPALKFAIVFALYFVVLVVQRRAE